MSAHAETDAAAGSSYISTGHLPDADEVTAAVIRSYERFRKIPTARTPTSTPRSPACAATCSACASSEPAAMSIQIGDADHEFSIMSVSKPFVFALICQRMGAEEARNRLGVNATGLPFNALAAIERAQDGRTNPMVNPGAIATTSLAPGTTADARWQFIHEGLSVFAGRTLSLNAEAFASASETNFRNQSTAACYGVTAGSTLIRRKRRSLYQAVLPQRIGARSGGHGGDTGRRWDRPVDQTAGR